VKVIPVTFGEQVYDFVKGSKGCKLSKFFHETYFAKIAEHSNNPFWLKEREKEKIPIIVVTLPSTLQSYVYIYLSDKYKYKN
jgi:hypothetical protein